MKAIIGLGNPGAKYKKNRHNIGFLVIDEIISKLNLTNPHEEKKLQAVVVDDTENEIKYILAKPLTFMNNSGESVSKIKNFYKLSNEDIWLVFDDIDLSLGQIRVKTSPSDSTHNGVRSVTQHIGEDYSKVRLGIYSKSKQSIDDFVLSDFSSDESSTVKKMVNKASDIIISAIKNNLLEPQTIDLNNEV